ncbi:MAG: hypothetical protein ACK4UQ_06375 [Brevundimonas sp.]
MAFRLETLISDARTIEYRTWSKWMRSAAALASRFHDEVDGDDPFAYNETASVSHLTAAATRAGYLALAEFTTTKKAASDRRRHAHGRADFWLGVQGRSWAFEFKQISNGRATAGNLNKHMQAALSCARCIKEWEADHAVAGLIVPIKLTGTTASQKAEVALRELATTCDHAWRIHGAPLGAETYLFFRYCR